jgi:uncharacterized membrane protein YeaQ/YmgE (transglycosylase-associated protein family)
MFSLIVLLIYGLIVGLIAKAIHPGSDPVGLGSTILVGVGGSYVGGFISWILGWSNGPIHASGLILGVIGGVICLSIWRWWNLKNDNGGAKTFWSGKIK